MIRALWRVIGTETHGRFRLQLALIAGYSILQGVVFALLVPLLRALLEGDTATAGRWLLALAAAVVVTGVVYLLQAMTSFGIGLHLQKTMQTRIANHVATLPLGWFTGDRVGPIGELIGRGTSTVVGVPVHQLLVVLAGFLTPATVAALMVVFDWRLAVAMLATTPLLWLAYRLTGRLIQRTDQATHDAAAEAGGRIVEYAKSQPVLRAFGRAGEGFSLLDGSLVRQWHAGRWQLTTAIPGIVLFALTTQHAFTVVLVVGVDLALGGGIEVAELVALLVLVTRFVEPLMAAGDVGGCSGSLSATCDASTASWPSGPWPSRPGHARRASPPSSSTASRSPTPPPDRGATATATAPALARPRRRVTAGPCSTRSASGFRPAP